MKKYNILIVDDNPGIQDALKLLLTKLYEQVMTISNPGQLYSELDKHEIDVVLLDMNFSAGVNTGNEGLFWLKEVKKRAPMVEVVMITAFGDVELAVRSLKEGAFDFVLKPWDNDKLKATLEAACRMRNSNLQISDLKSRERSLKQDASRNDPLIAGKSALMKEIMTLVDKIAATDANVLITGENGTGKELIAKEKHKKYPERAKNAR